MVFFFRRDYEATGINLLEYFGKSNMDTTAPRACKLLATPRTFITTCFTFVMFISFSSHIESIHKSLVPSSHHVILGERYHMVGGVIKRLLQQFLILDFFRTLAGPGFPINHTDEPLNDDMLGRHR